MKTGLPPAPRPVFSPLRAILLALVLILAAAALRRGWLPAEGPLRAVPEPASAQTDPSSLLAGQLLAGDPADPPTQGSLPAATPQYFLQPGTPAGIPNFLQRDAGCAWAGIGGQVFDSTGAPVSGMLVKVSGVYAGQPISKYAVTSSSQGFGPGGYDIYLGNLPQATRSLTLTLVDVGGAARSAPIPLATYADCQRNLLVVNLLAWTPVGSWYLPLAGKPRGR